MLRCGVFTIKKQLVGNITMLIEILCHYAKTPPFRATLWKMEIKMTRIIAWLFGFHGDMAVLWSFLLYIMKQIKFPFQHFHSFYVIFGQSYCRIFHSSWGSSEKSRPWYICWNKCVWKVLLAFKWQNACQNPKNSFLVTMHRF